MTYLEIVIATFVFATGTIAGLYLTLRLGIKEHWVWKAGLFVCLLLLGVGVLLIFIPYYSRYATLTGMIGVFLMIASVTYVRYKKARNIQFEGRKRSFFALQSALFLIVVGIGGGLFFKVITNQQDVKESQYGIVGLLIQVKDGVYTLIRMLERDHAERTQQAHKDSTIRAEIFSSINELKGLQQYSLKNDRDVKQELKRSRTKPVPPQLYFVPVPKSLPITDFDLNSERVKSVSPATLPDKPRIRKGKNQTFHENPEAQEQPVARIGEYGPENDR